MTPIRFVNGLLEPDPILTKRQEECLLFLWSYFDRERQYPTQREITEALGIASSTAASVLLPLVKKGVISRVGSGRRNVRITELGVRTLQGLGVSGAAQVELGQRM